METATINKVCLVPGLGTLIGAGTIAYHLPLAAFKCGAIAVGVFSSLSENDLTASIRDWYTKRGPDLKIEALSHLKQVGIGFMRLLPVIGAVLLVWRDFRKTNPSEAYINRLCIIPGLGTVIGFLTLVDHRPLETMIKIFSLVIMKGLFILANNNIIAPTPEECRERNIQEYNQLKDQTMIDIQMTIIGCIRLIPVIGGATLALNDHYQIVSLNP